MGCCLAVALMIALVRKAWFAVVPGATPPGTSFAPPARRSADGSVVGTVPVAATARPQSALRTAVALALGAAAVTTALYAAVVAVLRATGTAETMPDALLGWTARDVLVGALGAALIITAAVLYRGSGTVRTRGPVLIGAGAAWLALGLLDMHVLMLVEIGHHSLAADLLFHGPGALALAAGVLALSRRDARVSVRAAVVAR